MISHSRVNHGIVVENTSTPIIAHTEPAIGEKKKSARDELHLEAEGEFPGHWRDHKHEEDGTERSHINTNTNDGNRHDNSQVDLGNYFKTGENKGARALREAMDAVY